MMPKTENNIDLKTYNNLVKNIDIADISLREMSCKSADDLYNNDIFGALRLNIQSSTKDIILNQDGSIIFKKSFILTGKYKNKQVISIKVLYDVVYIMKVAMDIEDKYLQLFGDKNVPINVWPFFREICHSLTSKMSIPPLTLPVIRGISKKQR